MHVTATNVRTGRAGVFSRARSRRTRCSPRPACRRCIPAVEIDGEAYWDGGYLGNPALWPLVESGSPDILLVQINPMMRHELPRSAREIINRVNEISFNSSLMKELRTINRRCGGSDGARAWISGPTQPRLSPSDPCRRGSAGPRGLEQAQRRMGLSAAAVRAGAGLGGHMAGGEFRHDRRRARPSIWTSFSRSRRSGPRARGGSRDGREAAPVRRGRRQPRRGAPSTGPAAPGARSSAMRPGPISAAAAPCIQTAAAAASKAGIPWREQAAGDPRQHVARARRREPGRRVVIDRDAPIRRGDHRCPRP